MTKTSGTVVGDIIFSVESGLHSGCHPSRAGQSSHHRYENGVKQSYSVYFASLSLYANFAGVDISQIIRAMKILLLLDRVLR
jgi:hypothetical protein